MRPLGHSNIVSCQAGPADHMVILTYGVYTISVDLGISLQCWVAPTGHIVILTCGVLLPRRQLKHRLYIGIPKFPKAMNANVPKGISHIW